MVAGPLANCLLSIFIFTGIFLNPADPKIVPVVNSANQQITYSSDESFKINDQILSINNTSVKEAKDVNLELLTYAGYTGDLSFEVVRDGLENSTNVLVKVSNFLPTSESQSNPTEYLGIDISYLMQPIIGKVIPDGSADNAGIKSNDRILKIGDANINFASAIQKQVSENPNNNNIEFKIERDGKIIYLPVDIGSQSREDKIVGMLGVSFRTSRGVYQSLLKGVYETYNLSVKTIQYIGKMISGNMGTENLSGPIGIAQMAGNTAQAGFLPFMYLMALLSISLAVLNLLPIPVLDGGQLTLLGIDAIRGKPLPETAETII